MISIVKDLSLVALGFGIGRTKHVGHIIAAIKSAYAKVFHKQAPKA